MALHVMDEANRCLGCKVPQCQKGCPISTPIPEVIKLLKANKLDEAGKMLFENNPLTTVCSLVCNHENQCEGHCVLGRKGAPVHFSTIESYISTTYANKMTQGPAPSNGMRAAIIGSGPAGLAVADQLNKRGHLVTVYERDDRVGGLLMYGIPNMKLEKRVIDRKVSIMKEEKPNQKEQFKIPKEKISRFFAPGTPTQKIEDTIVKALELYRKRQRSLER